MVQGYFIAVGLKARCALQASQAVVEPGMIFRVAAVTALVGGTMFLMWLGEQITSRGHRQRHLADHHGRAFVAQLPATLVNLFEGGRTATISPLLILGILIACRSA
jgi:preprotein translocase subunit SecY